MSDDEFICPICDAPVTGDALAEHEACAIAVDQQQRRGLDRGDTESEE